MARDGIFPTFFLSGFECSTFDWKDRGRRDVARRASATTLMPTRIMPCWPPLGIAVAREGIPWPFVDKGDGEYDFSCIDPFLAAQRRHQVLPIWSLSHYGYPDGLDPLRDADGFVARFAAYARAAARYVADRAHHGPLCFCPINEPTFWGYMGGEWALVRAVRQDAPTTAAASPRACPCRHRRLQGYPRRISRTPVSSTSIR